MRRYWSPEELDRLRVLYPNQRTDKIAAALGRSVSSVYVAAAALGVKKSREFLASPESGWLTKGSTVGAATQFKKGLVPANKGLRRPGFSPGRMSETQFKKGDRTGKAAKNWRPVGTILADTDGYLRIKIREAVYGKEAFGFGNARVWPFVHRQVWEQANGPIPPHHVIVFKDRDRSNCKIENLECISRGELARRNQMWNNLPRELAEAIQLTGALKRKLRRLENDGTQQNVGSAGSPV